MGASRLKFRFKFQIARPLRSRAAARVGLLVYLPVLRGDGTPKGAPLVTAAAYFPDRRETEAHGNASRRPAAAASSSLGPDFRARARASSPSRQAFPPPAPVSSSH